MSSSPQPHTRKHTPTTSVVQRRNILAQCHYHTFQRYYSHTSLRPHVTIHRRNTLAQCRRHTSSDTTHTPVCHYDPMFTRSSRYARGTREQSTTTTYPVIFPTAQYATMTMFTPSSHDLSTATSQERLVVQRAHSALHWVYCLHSQLPYQLLLPTPLGEHLQLASQTRKTSVL